MIRRRVVLSPQARDDIVAIVRWIRLQGAPMTARSYAERLKAFITRLDLASERGLIRSDIRPGLRILPFEKRAVVAIRVQDDRVTILRIFSNGQDWEGALRGEDDHREAGD